MRTNACGTPEAQQIPYGPFGEAFSPAIQWTLLVQALMKVEATQVVQEVMAQRPGKTPEEVLEMLEEAAEPYLPDDGDLFVWNGRYGVFYAAMMLDSQGK